MLEQGDGGGVGGLRSAGRISAAADRGRCCRQKAEIIGEGKTGSGSEREERRGGKSGGRKIQKKIKQYSHT